MKENFQYSLSLAAPDFRFSDPVLFVPAQRFENFYGFGVAPMHFDGGIFFSLKCSFEECGKFILKQLTSICVTVSNHFRKAVKSVRRSFACAVQTFLPEKQKTYLSFCVFRR